MENNGKSDIYNVYVHRASYIKHLRSRNNFEKEMIIPEWLFEEPTEYNIKNIFTLNH